MNRRYFLNTCGAALAGAASLPATLRAQAHYPERPITFVVAYTPGSANDLLVRILAPDLGSRLGQPVIVDNKPGAGGSLGMGAVARSTADGYTLGLGSNATMAINRALFKKLPYDPLKDFSPVVQFGYTPNVLVAPAKGRIQSVADLRKRPGGKPLMYSSSGNGTTQHLEGVMLNNQLKLNANHVPYRGPAEAITALSAGEVDFGFTTLPSVLGAIQSGRVRVLGSTPLEPPASLPEAVPLARQGLTDFEKTDIWFGMVVPIGTSPAIIKTLEDASHKTLASAEIQQKLAKAGYTPAAPGTSAQFGAYVREQVAFWADLVEKSGASVD